MRAGTSTILKAHQRRSVIDELLKIWMELNIDGQITLHLQQGNVVRIETTQQQLPDVQPIVVTKFSIATDIITPKSATTSYADVGDYE